MSEYNVLFFPGVTTIAEWAVLRTSPAPWAELEFDNVIFTIPSSAIRDLERPDKVAALWDDIMKSVADLAVVSHKFPRKERFVADVQISHGNTASVPTYTTSSSFG